MNNILPQRLLFLFHRKYISFQRWNRHSSKVIMASDENISQKLHEWIPKSPMALYAITFLVMFLFMLTLNNRSSCPCPSQPVVLETHQNLQQRENPQTQNLTEPSNLQSSGIIPRSQEKISIQESTEEMDVENEEDPLIPPENISREERIEWFKKQIPNLEILKSSSLSDQFHYRVLNFLNNGCSILFHIIWLSPAKSFGKREFLTMDTLFKSHPRACLLIISRSMDSQAGYRILKPLLDRGFKVMGITPDLPFLVKGTPAEAWLEEISSGTKDPGQIPLSQNLSNLIRLAMLYKYGGVYMDVDMVILRDLSGLKNAVGAQSVDGVTRQWTRLSGAVMIFDINHPILVDFLQEFATTFDGNRWGYNGPYLVSRVIGRVENMPGYDLTILRPKAFYPVDWIRIGSLFKKPSDDNERRWVEDKVIEMLYEGGTYAVHLWNKMSRELKIEEGSVMARIIAERCVVCDNIVDG